MLAAGKQVRMLVLVFGTIACGGGDDGAGPDASSDGPAPVPDASSRELLSAVGLYSDIESKTLAPGVLEFEPNHRLWSDGAVKTRWIKLPPGTQIDTSDMNRWSFPVGTKFFKEFVRDGIRVETRMIERTGEGPRDYWLGAFIWNLEETEAFFAEGGGTNVNGTDHDVPTAENCWTCHIGEPGRSLGVSALQLSGAPGAVTLATLAEDDALSDPPATGTEFTIPGGQAAQDALGYLHANCGHCHNSHGAARPDTDLVLRLDLGATTVEETTTYQSTVGVSLDYYDNPDFTKRIVAGDSISSAVYERLMTRGNDDQMPPIATELVDSTGVLVVSNWIDSL